MQKKDMVKDLAVKYNISQAESKRIFDAVFDQLSEVLSKGDYFTEAGFGTFTVAHVKKRKGYNPAIQKFMMLPPKLKPKFKSSDILKSKVNGWLNDTIIDDDDSDDDENDNVISTEAEKSPESSAALDSSAALGMTNAAGVTNAAGMTNVAGMTNAAGEINAAAFDKPVEQTSDHSETEIVTPEEQSALIINDNQEAANV